LTVLGPAGLTMLEALSGQPALELARARAPDLIMVDLMMPVMNGYEFVRAPRSDPVVGNIRVTFCTATLRSGRGARARRELRRVRRPDQADLRQVVDSGEAVVNRAPAARCPHRRATPVTRCRATTGVDQRRGDRSRAGGGGHHRPEQAEDFRAVVMQNIA